jgi:hypothetical protein
MTRSRVRLAHACKRADLASGLLIYANGTLCMSPVMLATPFDMPNLSRTGLRRIAAGVGATAEDTLWVQLTLQALPARKRAFSRT